MSYRSRKHQRLLAAMSRDFSVIRTDGELGWKPRFEFDTTLDSDSTGWERAIVSLAPDGWEGAPITMGQVDVVNKQVTLRTWAYQHQALSLRAHRRSMPLSEGDYEHARQVIATVLQQYGFHVINLDADTLPRRPVRFIKPQRKPTNWQRYVRPAVMIIAIIVIIKMIMYMLQVLEKSSGL